MDSTEPRMVVCPSCGGENLARFDRCFLCDQPLAPGKAGAENPWAAPAVELKPSSRTFTLGSLMLVIALIAVCLGVLVEVPGLGVILLLIATPALIRTLVAVSRRKAAGQPLLWWEKLAVFAGSVGVVTAIGLGALIAFVLTCFPVGFMAMQSNFQQSQGGLLLAIGIGIGAAAFVGFALIRRLWPQRNP